MGKYLVLFLLLVGVACHTHSHSHEAPHAKYGRAINEQAAREVVGGEHDHGHSHEHAHSHGAGGCPHSHGGDHGHTHEHHGHAHEHHAHSHDDHGHAHEDHGHSHEEHGHSHEDHGHSHEDHGHFHEGHGHSHEHGTPKKRSLGINEYHYEGALSFLNDPVTRTRWYSIGATLLISAFPCFILLFIPINENSSESSALLKVLLAFGSGGLLGDAFLHLIPHATPTGSGGHSHSHSHSHEPGHSHEPHDMSVGGWVLAGIIAFLTVEKFVRILRGEHGHGHSHGHSHGHGHSHSGKKNKLSDDESDDKKKTEKKEEKNEKDEDHPVAKEGMKIAAILNLIADFAHNFTDGLAIGASFSAGTTVGVVTTATVLVHEIPHEIGDFAILIQSGYSKPRAMAMQLVTAIGALSGCILSLWATNAGDLADAAGASAVLPFTAGGFIYIATVSVIPELLENSSTWQSIKEIFALLLGIFLMYLIALYE